MSWKFGRSSRYVITWSSSERIVFHSASKAGIHEKRSGGRNGELPTSEYRAMSFSSTWIRRNPTSMINSLARSRTLRVPELATECPVPPGGVGGRLLADPVEVVTGGQAQERHGQQAGQRPASCPTRHLEGERQGRGGRPRPQDPVVRGELGGAEPLGRGEGGYAEAGASPRPHHVVDQGAGQAGTGPEGEGLVPTATTPCRADRPYRQLDAPQGERAGQPHLGLEDQTDAAAELVAVVRDRPQRTEDREGSADPRHGRVSVAEQPRAESGAVGLADGCC